jgi:aldose 1-epimerase
MPGMTPAASTADPPSGQQLEIVRGEQRAVVVEVGGGIRSYAVGEHDVLESYSVDAICDGAHGAVLAPWPNRLEDGRYTFDGQAYQLPLSEPATHNAIHGLLRWTPWRPERRSADHVAVTARVHPQPGYPFDLEVTVGYRLGDDGLHVTTTATNRGDLACPYGSGQHPYLSAGGGPLDGCTFAMDARTRVVTDPQRQLPQGHDPVARTPYDFRSPRLFGDQRLDDPFTDLDRDSDGRAWGRLTGTDGLVRELWVGPAYPYLEAFSGDTLAPHRQRRALALEPMTCPPNALRSGESLVRLEPGESTVAEWGVRLSG